MPDIHLTPQGQLRWEPLPEDSPEKRMGALENAFARDWREGWFSLAAEKPATAAFPDLFYWQSIAERYLTALCHFPETADSWRVEPPSEADCAAWILSAPPMKGGEYLTPESLLGLWNALDAWTARAVSEAGGLAPFLTARASKWRQVGRVCFHLAENKANPELPFAFMATYATGLGAAGQVKHLPLRKALEQYAGANNRPALVKLLSPVHQAAERCLWVKKMVDSGEIYQAAAWPPDRAYRFLLSVGELEASGLAVRLPDWWRKRPRPKVSATIGETKRSGMGVDALFDFDVRMALGDESLSREDIAALLAGGDGLVLFKGRWVEVDKAKLQEAIEHWESLREEARDGAISFIEGMRLLAGATPDLGRAEAKEEELSWANVNAGEAMRSILEGLRDPARLAMLETGGALRATLRPYQRTGLAWLHFVSGLGLGACLADDMGLGKTVQVLALLLCLHQREERSAPSLLVVPTSLLGNWRAEAARFTPDLKLVFLHPAECDKSTLGGIAKAPQKRLENTDLAVTTYGMLIRQPWLETLRWDLVICDEAQALKNPGARQTKAVKKLDARARIVLTGTPVENRLGDLWSLFDFINPGLLGSSKTFENFLKKLQAGGTGRFEPLRRLAAPYILRRLKTDRAIISDLPDKVEMPQHCTLTKKQVQYYKQVVEKLSESLENSEGIQRRGLVLQSLMRLKQVCNHPSQLTGDNEYAPEESGKFNRIAEICGELAERQERVLVFTQFREIIAPLETHLAEIFGKPGLVLHGGTNARQRKDLVERFQSGDGPPFFLLSLKAGGAGLNLTAASHVIHFDRWWNPAVENQATDRAFRIGQNRNVLVHKFITSGTIEERIDALIEEKRQLAEEVLEGGGEIRLTELSDDELMNLVRLDLDRALE